MNEGLPVPVVRTGPPPPAVVLERCLWIVMIGVAVALPLIFVPLLAESFSMPKAVLLQAASLLGGAIFIGCVAMGGGTAVAALDRMKSKVNRSEAMSQAKAELSGDTVEDRLAALGKEDEIEKLLNELKARRSQS